MTDDRLHAAVDQARAGLEAEGGWEPPDWGAVLRHHRRRHLATTAGLVAVVGVVAPLLRSTVVDRPPSLTYWFLVAFTLVAVAGAVHSRVSTAGRERWEWETRRDVRISHALRHHVSIGATDRSLVTGRATTIDTWAKVAFVGWPLLALLLIAGILEDERLPAALIALVVVACLVLVARAVRQARLARRWLADPLPRGVRTP